MSTASTIPIQTTVEERTQAIRERLDALTRANSGVITPELVIKDARNPKSPLHKEFTWDDKTAAHEYRIDQARRVIQAYWTSVRTEKMTFEAPWYVRDPRKAPWEQGYIPAASIKDDVELAYDVFHTEVAKAKSYLERARSMAQTLKVDLQLENIIHEVESLTTAAETQIAVKNVKAKRSA